MNVQEKKLKVSICVVTYNQEKYIRQCLQSIVDQKTNFDFEVIVGDDCSTDGTRKIVQDFADKYPAILKPIYHAKNVGPVGNYISVHKEAIGEYIAHIDGDDWCAPNKLLSQSAFLDGNTDCVAVVHKLIMRDHNGNALSNTWPKLFLFEKYDLARLVTTHPAFGHSSIMYRNGALTTLTNSEFNEFIDFQIYIHLASQGFIGILNENLGSYTCGVGVSASQSLHGLAIQALIYAKNLGLNENIFRNAMARQYFIFAKKALIENDYVLYKNLISNSMEKKCISITQFILYVARNFPALIKIGFKLRKVKFK